MPQTVLCWQVTSYIKSLNYQKMPRSVSSQIFLIHCTFKRVCTLVFRMWLDDLIIWECCCCCLVAKSCPTSCNPMEPDKLLCPWDFPGRDTGVGWHALFQGIFPSQGLNLRHLHWAADSLPLSHLGSPIWEYMPHIFAYGVQGDISIQGTSNISSFMVEALFDTDLI